MKKFNKFTFDETYRKTKGLLWGSKPNPLTIKLTKLIPKGSKVLDLGCGEGKDAIFLARKGYDVTAVDISSAGIKKIKEMTKGEDIRLNAKVADIAAHKIYEKYDAIISLAAIHFLKKHQIKKLIEQMKEMTNPRGINIIIVFRKGETESKKWDMYYFDDNELKSYYKNWNIICYKEYRKKDKHGKGRVHYHDNADLIAQKP